MTGPVETGIIPATNGSATTVSYIQNPSVFVNQGNAFGNLGRNVIIGPGFSNLDIALTKNTKITERFTIQFRADAFDSLNQTNFDNPVTTMGSATLGLITADAICGRRFRHFAPASDVHEAVVLIPVKLHARDGQHRLPVQFRVVEPVQQVNATRTGRREAAA